LSKVLLLLIYYYYGKPQTTKDETQESSQTHSAMQLDKSMLDVVTGTVKHSSSRIRRRWDARVDGTENNTSSAKPEVHDV